MRGGEGYKIFLDNITNKLFKSRFDRLSPGKKKGITFDEAEELITKFLLYRNYEQITIKQAKKMAAAEIKRLKKKIKELEQSPSHKYLPILRKKRKSPRYTIKRQRSLHSRKPRYFDEKRYYMTRLKKNYKTKKGKTKRSSYHILSPSEKWGTV